MLRSLTSLIGNLPTEIQENLEGVPLDEINKLGVASFFNIPLVIGNDFVGLINVSSKEKHFYKEDEVTILYQIVGQASNALLKLKNVLETEKGKLTAMISGLADGVFMVDTSGNLMVINKAAKSFLTVHADTPTLTDVLVAIGKQYNLADRISQSLKENKPIEEKEVDINDKVFQLFITPVLEVNEEGLSKPLGALILCMTSRLRKPSLPLKKTLPI